MTQLANVCQSLTPRTTGLPQEVDEPTLYSALKTQSDFHLQTNHISNRLLADPGLSAEAALSIGGAMEQWTLSLPLYFQLNIQPTCHFRWYLFARARLWWRFWNLKIIVFRHILLRRAIADRGQVPDIAASAEQEECKRLCVEAARFTIDSICRYSMQELTRLEGWYAT
jgi:transcriptional regulatory protein GAL4